MSSPFRILKPAQNEPCNGCGTCCQVEACHISMNYLDSCKAPCVALEWRDEKWRCEMMLRPSHHLKKAGLFNPKLLANDHKSLKRLFKNMMRAGGGCDSPDPKGSYYDRRSKCLAGHLFPGPS